MTSKDMNIWKMKNKKYNFKTWLTTNMIFGMCNICVIRRNIISIIKNPSLSTFSSFRIWCHYVNCKLVFLCFCINIHLMTSEILTMKKLINMRFLYHTNQKFDLGLVQL